MELSLEQEKPTAVTVRCAYKRFNKYHVVLKGLNMTVPEGSIYGLLGPSGCGKTTLLSCIVGRSELDSGEIKVKAESKSNIGYMPQELALYKEFSICETLSYYGILFGMTKTQIKQRTEELVNFLQLPSEFSIIQNLSGGQQRRVSLTVALLHNPSLLILDEPTVGVDPVLSHSIWQHLLELAIKGNKTIIITTHYIEEARQAHVIGLMRGGILLAEHPPLQLMLLHNCDNLEQAFLELSQKQSTQSEEDLQMAENYPKCAKKPNKHLNDGFPVTWRRIESQFMKSVYWMKRNIPIMAFLMLLPIVQCVLFNLCIGHDPLGLHVAVVNEELVDGLSDCTQVPTRGCHLDLPLSCRYIDKLREKTIKFIEYKNIEDAKAAVHRNDAWGVMYFASNYTECLIERINLLRGASDLALNLSEVNIWMDMSNQYIGNLMRRDMLFGFVSFLRQVFTDCGWPPQVADIPIAVSYKLRLLFKP
uniref:ABC transporter domain-containing protein n=1 Tax=Clastoptera arizonana TaxID=38151 RepID=A0A1B6DER0_9HEMI